MVKALAPGQLRWTVNDASLDIAALEKHKDDLTGKPGALGQERALAALELGLGIRQRGYNIFVVGASGTGRTSTLRTVLDEQARTDPVPDDVILVYNFEDRDRPHTLCVPPGEGPGIRRRYETLVEKMIAELEKAFESETFLSQRQDLERAHDERADENLQDIEAEAKAAGFLLTRAQGSLSLGVADAAGNPMGEEEYEQLTAEQKQAYEEAAEGLQGGLEDALRKIRVVERETDEELEALSRATAAEAIDPLFAEAESDLSAHPALVDHLARAKADVLDRLRRLVPSDVPEQEQDGPERATTHQRRLIEEELDLGHDEPALLRYRVNVLVTRDKDGGAPVVVETHPTASKLIGRIVHKTRGGEATTDHTRIKAGALFFANGGYLILQAQDLFREPTAWEGLKRALKNHSLELDDPGEPGRMLTMENLRPEPLPLAVKVCLIGTPDLYYALARTDPDFNKLFKVKVDFDLEMDRSPERVGNYLRFLVGLAHEEGLLPLDTSGAGRLIEHAARVSQNRGRLTTRFGWIADLVREASFFAKKAGAERITRAHVKTALDARAEREGFLELRMHEDIADNRVRIDTAGEVVGQANGLTVIDLGSYQFGTPARITCRVGAGKGELVDIERETELGGPIHTKGTMILRGILLDRFGQEGPLKLSASVCIEQSYSDIDGDSASLAECCALFSALADVPLAQKYAMTGSIDQRGQVQAVGGVNEKIEGFFRATSQRDEKGPYGVLIPVSNLQDLMLDEEVVAAADDGRFSVHAVATLEEALEHLTGMPWETLRERAAHTLERFADITRERGDGDRRAPRSGGRPQVAAKSDQEPRSQS